MNNTSEVYISVDVETAGPVPGAYSLLTIGACDAFETTQTFSCEIKPINDAAVPAALKVSGLSLQDLAKTGLEPNDAMAKFANWIEAVAHGRTPVFVGFNAPFDWAFINHYFHQFHGGNPFGFSALDIKALYMGATGCSWAETRSSKVAERVSPTLEGNHNALQDALYQAELFRLTLGLIR